MCSQFPLDGPVKRRVWFVHDGWQHDCRTNHFSRLTPSTVVLFPGSLGALAAACIKMRHIASGSSVFLRSYSLSMSSLLSASMDYYFSDRQPSTKEPNANKIDGLGETSRSLEIILRTFVEDNHTRPRQTRRWSERANLAQKVMWNTNGSRLKRWERKDR